MGLLAYESWKVNMQIWVVVIWLLRSMFSPSDLNMQSEYWYNFGHKKMRGFKNSVKREVELDDHSNNNCFEGLKGLFILLNFMKLCEQWVRQECKKNKSTTVQCVRMDNFEARLEVETKRCNSIINIELIILNEALGDWK